MARAQVKWWAEIPGTTRLDEAMPHVVALEQDGKTVYAMTTEGTALGLEIGAWIDLPEDNHLDLSGGALVRLKF
jgi:hypothetical protein